MTGTEVVTFRIILETDQPEQGQAFESWAGRVGLENDGCGCCVDIYTVSATRERAAQLERLLAEVGGGVEYLPAPA